MGRMKDRHGDSKCQTENVALNAKQKTSNSFERRSEDVALNTKMNDVMILNAKTKM